MAKVCPLFSGSSGNSYYIEASGSGILVDAGRSAKQIENAMRANELDIKRVQAIFVTHEHSDHIKGLRVFASRHHIPVYASPGTLQALEGMGELAKVTYAPIAAAGMEVGELFIRSFPTSHDSAESVGYQIELPQERKITLATDLGVLTQPVKECLQGSDLVILESNHDVGMLQNGIYPYPLKRRILSDTGHLSNHDCADYLPELIRQGTTRILLSHLSHENNTPDLARQTSLCSLQVNGMQENVDYQLYVAPRENQTGRSILL